MRENVRYRDFGYLVEKAVRDMGMALFPLWFFVIGGCGFLMIFRISEARLFYDLGGEYSAAYGASAYMTAIYWPITIFLFMIMLMPVFFAVFLVIETLKYLDIPAVNRVRQRFIEDSERPTPWEAVYKPMIVRNYEQFCDYLGRKLTIRRIAARNREIGEEIQNLILKQGELTEDQRAQFTEESRQLQAELREMIPASEDHFLNPESRHFDPDAAAHDPDRDDAI